MTDSNYGAEEDSILTSDDFDNPLVNNQNQEISLTSDIFNLGDVFHEDSLSLFDLNSVEVTISDLAGSDTDTVGTLNAPSNNLGAGYDNQEILNTSLPDSGYKNVWGTPVADSDYWRHQNGDATCAIVAQISIYESITGEYIYESDAAEYAEAQGWFDPLTGTPLEHSGRILNALDIETNQYWNNYDGNNYDVNLDTIGAALNNGDKVIAAIDSDEIWDPSYNTSTGRPIEQTDPGEVAYEDPDHSVWVTGIEQYSDNTWNIILNDSGTPDGQADAVNYWDFMNAWDDSDNFLTIVDV